MLVIWEVYSTGLVQFLLEASFELFCTVVFIIFLCNLKAQNFRVKV